MFSGKTTQLVRRLRRYTHAKKICIAVCYEEEKRYTTSDQICTHDRFCVYVYRETYSAIRARKLGEVFSNIDVKNVDVVGIDEGQFFPDLAEVAEQLANEGLVVIVAALDATFQRKAFNNVLDIVPLAEKIIKLYAICVKCSQEAYFTERIVDKLDVEFIGGKESYQSVCRKCYNEAVKQKTLKSHV